jgi:uncharacterized protein involved in oxidation of intracellular sulfur
MHGGAKDQSGRSSDETQHGVAHRGIDLDIAMKALLILNDAAYGSERTYNGARVAGALAKQAGNEVRVFLLGDAATAAHRGQKVPAGFYNLEVMLGSVVKHAGIIGVCSTCMDARGIAADDLIEGAHRSTLQELTEWTGWADKVLVF